MLRPITTALAAMLLALLAAGCSGSEPGGGGEATDPAPTAPAPEASAGHRLVALGRVGIEVPDGWATDVFDGCGRMPAGAVVFRLPGRTACGDRLDRHHDFVVLEPIDRDDSLLLAMGRGSPVGGQRVRETGIACVDTRPQVCDQTFAVPGLGVVVQVHVRSDTAEADVRAIRTSLTLLPEGYAAVPPIRFGTSDEEALATLADAGLEGHVPEVDWPHYVTDTEPPAGTVLPEGSTVELHIGDG